jgi:methionyl-tRNA formyltransferase
LGATARERGVQILDLDDVYDIPNMLFLSLEYDRIVNPELFKSDFLYNIHFSLLPAYKGMYTSVLPILHGADKSGVTLHRIDRGIDTGDIVDQTEFDIGYRTSYEMYETYNALGCDLLDRWIDRLLAGSVHATRQPIEKSTYYSKSTLDFSDREIDFRSTACQLSAFVRAMRFRPYQLSECLGRSVSHVRSLEQRSVQKPGTLIEQATYSARFSTIDYDVEIVFDVFPQVVDACKSDEVGLLRTLQPYVHDFNEITATGESLLSIALANGSYMAAQYLCVVGADVSWAHKDGRSLLHYLICGYRFGENIAMLEDILMRLRHELDSDFIIHQFERETSVAADLLAILRRCGYHV